MDYESALLSPEISWDALTAAKMIPPRLYKYQSFMNADGTINSH